MYKYVINGRRQLMSPLELTKTYFVMIIYNVMYNCTKFNQLTSLKFFIEQVLKLKTIQKLFRKVKQPLSTAIILLYVFY